MTGLMGSRRKRSDFDMTAEEQLNAFLKSLDQLAHTRLGQSGMESGVTIRFDQTKGLESELCEPEESDLRDFLMTLRHFVLKDEPVHVERIANIVWQSISSDQIRDELKKARAAWKQQNRTGDINYVINQKRIEPADLLDLWLNGYYFHPWGWKRKALEEITHTMPHLTRYMFLQLVIDLARYVVYLGTVIRFARAQGLLDTSRAE